MMFYWGRGGDNKRGKCKNKAWKYIRLVQSNKPNQH